MSEDMPEEIYISFAIAGEVIGTFLRKWDTIPFEDGQRYVRSDLSKLVDVDAELFALSDKIAAYIKNKENWEQCNSLILTIAAKLHQGHLTTPDTITISRKWLEGMKHSEAAAKNGNYCTGYNAAIDEILNQGKGK